MMGGIGQRKSIGKPAYVYVPPQREGNWNAPAHWYGTSSQVWCKCPWSHNNIGHKVCLDCGELVLRAPY